MRWRAQMFFGNERAVSGILYKNNFVSDLLRSQHLFESQHSFITNLAHC